MFVCRNIMVCPFKWFLLVFQRSFMYIFDTFPCLILFSAANIRAVKRAVLDRAEIKSLLSRSEFWEGWLCLQNTQIGVLSSTLHVDFWVILNVNATAITLHDTLLLSFNISDCFSLNPLFGTRSTFHSVMVIYRLRWGSTKSIRGHQRKRLEPGSRETEEWFFLQQAARSVNHLTRCWGCKDFAGVWEWLDK